MIDTPTLALAFVAGLVSFLSPCCLPLVPGYLATVTGVSPAGDRRVDPAIIGRSLLFVGTFSLLFILLGLSATLAGEVLFDSKQTLNTVAGVLVIMMGLFFMASVFVVRLGRDFRPRGLAERAGRGGPVVAGAAFAIAWTPCVGPTLGAILGIASTQNGTARGALLLAIYSAGLALPFIASAVAFDAASRSFAFFKRHHAAIQLGSGAVLVAMGVLVLTNQLFRLNIEMQQFLDGFGLNFFQSI
jgi:cytochrome c-type biogenesis protein